jgi:hypothetical protein
VLTAAGATVAMVVPSGEEVEDQGLFRPSQATRRKEVERISRERCMAVGEGQIVLSSGKGVNN